MRSWASSPKVLSIVGPVFTGCFNSLFDLAGPISTGVLNLGFERMGLVPKGARNKSESGWDGIGVGWLGSVLIGMEPDPDGTESGSDRIEMGPTAALADEIARLVCSYYQNS